MLKDQNTTLKFDLKLSKYYFLNFLFQIFPKLIVFYKNISKLTCGERKTTVIKP